MAKLRIQLNSLSFIQAFEDPITAALAKVKTFGHVDEATDFMLENSPRGVSYSVVDGKNFIRASGLCGGKITYYPHPREKRRSKNQTAKPLRLHTPTKNKAKTRNSLGGRTSKALHKKRLPKTKTEAQKK